MPEQQWTVETLRSYVDMRFEEQNKATAAALNSAKEAVLKAEGAIERRFENTNEWRNTIETLQRTYMPRTESDQRYRSLTEKVDELTARVAAREATSRGMTQGWAALVATIGVLVAVVSVMFAIFRG